eukprot:12902129-Prorocentrum_lima.AAC.1
MHSGLGLLLYGLSRKFAPLPGRSANFVDDTTRQFQPETGEPIDQGIPRFDLLKHKVQTTLGNLPQTDPQLTQMM